MRHRVERVGDREHTCRERNLLTALAARIPVAVPTLVVRADHLTTQTVEAGNGRHDALTEPRVLPDLVELRRREPRALQEHGVGHGEHADVVEPAAVLEARILQQLRRDLRRELDGEQGHPLGMLPRLGELAAAVVPELQRAHQRVDHGGSGHRLRSDRIEGIADTARTRGWRHA